jgi:ABC-2 type transport system ATP-binding protein
VAGRIVAEGTARELRARGNPPSIVSFTGAAGPERIETHEPVRTLHEVTERALADGRELPDLEVRRPTLEDVYLRLIAEQEAAA